MKQAHQMNPQMHNRENLTNDNNTKWFRGGVSNMAPVSNKLHQQQQQDNILLKSGYTIPNSSSMMKKFN
jgi:hypothetical protein